MRTLKLKAYLGLTRIRFVLRKKWEFPSNIPTVELLPKARNRSTRCYGNGGGGVAGLYVYALLQA